MLRTILQDFVFNLHYDTILMPSLEYHFTAWILRLGVICVACYLWYLSIKLFKKNMRIIPGIMNIFAYFLLFIACYETDIIMYHCERVDCIHLDRETYYGIMGICVHKVEECFYVRRCDDSERHAWKIAEVRLWGGFIGALPYYYHRGITGLSAVCPCCGSPVGTFTLPKCEDCSMESAVPYPENGEPEPLIEQQ